jgi:hypothetical protein
MAFLITRRRLPLMVITAGIVVVASLLALAGLLFYTRPTIEYAYGEMVEVPRGKGTGWQSPLVVLGFAALLIGAGSLYYTRVKRRVSRASRP